jgi:ABC-type phosphate transport system substrate-binding protein
VNPHNPVRNLSIEELRRLYLGRTTTFSQNQPVLLLERATPPQAIAEMEDLKRVLARNVGAIGFLDLSAADQSVKVLTLNSPHPGDADYPLRRGRL